MKKFGKIMLALLVVVPCMLVMVACDKVSAAEDRPPIMDQPVVEGPAPEEPVTPVDPVEDPETPVDLYQGVDNQVDFAAILADAQPGSTTYVRLNKNMVFRTPLIVNTKVVLDLNGKTISNNRNIRQNDENIWSLISVRQNGNLIINGDGRFQTKAGDCYVIDLQGEHTRCTINGGTYIGNRSVVYVQAGRLTINGGNFQIHEVKDEDGNVTFAYMLDCDDANYNKTARIWVQGGKFTNFNPAACGAESEEADHTNFVTQGYESTVVKAIYNDGKMTDNQVEYNPSQELIDDIKEYNWQIDTIYEVAQAPEKEPVASSSVTESPLIVDGWLYY